MGAIVHVTFSSFKHSKCQTKKKKKGTSRRLQYNKKAKSFKANFSVAGS